MNLVIIAFIVFVVMEPITTFIHRYVMHFVGWVWHKSHHDRQGKVFELNDLYPIIFSFVAILLFVIGMKHPVYSAVATGITSYGAIYFVVHEIIIHSRFGQIKNNNKIFQYWRFGHNVHHQFQKAPYGFIIPITPSDLAKQAKENPRDLINRY